MTPADSPIEATLIPGDGIGPEITDAVLEALDALDAPIAWDRQVAGVAAIERCGDPLPEITLASIRRTRLALKGPLTTPIGGGYRSVNVALRNALELYANVRPARTVVPGGRFDDIDLVLVRENLGGLYGGSDQFFALDGDPHGIAVSTGINTRSGCRRIARFAFEYAVRAGRRKVTLVHKANTMKAISGLFLETAREVAEDYAGRLEVDDRIVDACAMQLVLDPWRFDVIVTTNLFGDILSEEIAGLVGGLGFAPAANIGERGAIFEAVHGSAPDIAGTGRANPVALLLATALMLEHVGHPELAGRLRAGIDVTLNADKVRTPDIGGSASTSEFARALARRLRARS
jgi:isocitrate dehydrogenase (NAD+)